MNVSVYGSTSRRERKREINRANSHEHTRVCLSVDLFEFAFRIQSGSC